MQQLEAQTKSFHAMTDRLSSNIMADFEVMLQKQLSSSIEGYVLRYFCYKFSPLWGVPVCTSKSKLVFCKKLYRYGSKPK